MLYTNALAKTDLKGGWTLERCEKEIFNLVENLKYIDDCEKIAQTLDISPAAVSVTMKRARNKLFNILKYIIYSNAIK